MEPAITHTVELLRQVFTGNVTMEAADLKRLLEGPAMSEEAVKGIVLRHRKNAEALLKRVIESDPESLIAIALLVQIMEADARYEEVEAELAKDIERCTSQEDMAYLHLIYGRLMEHVDRNKAVAHYMKALELDRGRGIQVGCAAGMWRLGMERKARKLLRAGMRQFEPGDPLRTAIKMTLDGKIPYWILIDPYSISQTCRLHLRMPERDLEVLQDVWTKLEHEGYHKLSTRDTIAERDVSAAREMGNHADVLLRIDDERRENPDGITDPDGLALDRWISVIHGIKPGFELAMAELFFKDRCGKCRHPQGQKSAEGLSACPLDYEFREYLYETITSILARVRSGVKLESALAESLGPEQDVPEWIRRRYLKLKGCRSEGESQR